MLTHLKIQNLAILENIEATFHPGFTVLTGETGAGKSLVLDALQLLLGERASSDVIRSGEDLSKIQAVFEPLPDTIKPYLDEDLTLDDSLIIERQIHKDKGNVVKVNGAIVPLALLKKIAPYLADLHGQADTRSLLRPPFYPFLIDALSDELKTLSRSYQEAYHTYQAAKASLETFQDSTDQLEKEATFMQFQVDELSTLNPSMNDYESLKQTVLEMENHDQIFHHLKSVEEGFNRGALSDLNALRRSFQKLTTLKAMGDLNERFESALIELEDIESSVAHLTHQLDFDPQVLASAQERLVLYERLMRKHKTDVNGLLAIQEELTEKLSQLEDHAGHEKALKETLQKSEDALLKAAHVLHEKRQAMAKTKIQDVTDTLKELSLEHAIFDIQFAPITLESMQAHTPSGIDFVLTPNPGEPLKSLHKAASGGELSRVMLAIKVAFLKKDQVSTLIFDEIDTGVSGKVAASVGRLLQTIASEIQVIAITHLPQVAAKAHHHILIEKTVEAGRTRAHLKTLDADARIETLAEMLSDGTLSEEQRLSAKALLQ